MKLNLKQPNFKETFRQTGPAVDGTLGENFKK